MSNETHHHSLSLAEAMYSRSGLDELPPISPRVSATEASSSSEPVAELYRRSGLDSLPSAHESDIGSSARQLATEAAESLKAGAQKVSDSVKSTAQSVKATLSEPLETPQVERAVAETQSPIASTFASVKDKLAEVGTSIKDSIVPSRPAAIIEHDEDRILREQRAREAFDANAFDSVAIDPVLAVPVSSITPAQTSAQIHTHLQHTAKPQDGFPRPGSAEEKARDQMLKDTVAAHYDAVFTNSEVIKGTGQLGNSAAEVDRLAAETASARAKADENDARAKAHLAHADLTRKLSKA